MDMNIMPHPGFSLTGCSFANRTTDKIKYTHGVDAGPWTFWIEVKVSVKYRNRTVNPTKGEHMHVRAQNYIIIEPIYSGKNVNEKCNDSKELDS